MERSTEIDIVILSFNRVESTLETISSVLIQKGATYKIWLVDQGSIPNNLGVLRTAIRKLKQVFLYELGRNVGVAEGRNIGIALGDAPIVVCLDNDAVFQQDNALWKIRNCFSAQLDLGAIGFRIQNYYTGSLDKFSWVYPRAQINLAEQYFQTTRYCGAGHALRREAFLRAGGYDSALFFYWEEVDLSRKLINLGYEIAYDPEVTILHKISSESRVNWEDDRYYYLVRNAIYLEWKFYASVGRISITTLGYIVKGFYNGLFYQSIKGAWAGLIMSIRWKDRSTLLSGLAQKYINKYETSYRGSFWERVHSEVLEKLPRSY